MFFSNLIGEAATGSVKRSTNKGLNFFVNKYDGVQEANVYKVNDSLVVCSKDEVDPDAISAFGEDLIGEASEPFHKNLGCKLTYGDVQDTEENPLIWVLAKEVTFFEGIKTYIKYININPNMVLVCLVYGACGFNVGGEEVVLTRCIETEPKANTGRKTCSGEELVSRCYVVDGETGYNMAYDVTNAVVVSIKVSKGEFSYKKVNNGIVVLSTSGLDEARKKREVKLQKEKERKAQEQERRRIAEAKAREEKRKEEELKEFSESPLVGSSGAQEFMKAVRNLKNAVG